MPNWTRQSPDTAPVIRYIHLKKEEGVAPDRKSFKATEEGKRLVNTHGDKKVDYCWKQTIGRYDDWKQVGGGKNYLKPF